MRQSASARVRMREVFIRPPGGLGYMAIIVPVLECVMASMQTIKMELDTSSIPLHF